MNDEYYLVQGGEKTGPYTFNELINMELNIHTEIITPQSDKPQYASELPEFDSYFEGQGIYFPTLDNLATHGKRLSAFLIDYFGIYIIVSNVVTRTGVVVLPASYRFGDPVPTGMAILSACMFATFLVYKTICEVSGLKGSLGKKIFKLIVVDVNGQKLSLPRAFLRNLGVILSLTIWVPFLSVFFSEHRQAWYDSLAKTYVVSTNPN
ncbi:RDD family protein [Mucilaginibacter sp. UYCu711]|uniref:RDD family protein n=1 Tax=Mucilaginibacter sp. UYCu711 TaxID=3156339 RepID=UPI003D1D90C5